MKNISRRSFFKKMAGLAGTAVLGPKVLAKVDFVEPPKVDVSVLTSQSHLGFMDGKIYGYPSVVFDDEHYGCCGDKTQ